MNGDELNRIMRVHSTIARIYADDRFPPADRINCDLRMFALTAVWVVGAEQVDRGFRLQRVAQILKIDNWQVWRLIRDDLPRYEPNEIAGTGKCEAPMARRDGPCGRRGNLSARVTNPADGTWRMMWACSDRNHRAYFAELADAERARQDAGTLPTPLPNRGGLLPCYLRWNWAKNYKLAAPHWEPPSVGICADDWPVMSRVTQWEPRPLKVVFGGVEQQAPTFTDASVEPPALTLVDGDDS